MSSRSVAKMRRETLVEGLDVIERQPRNLARYRGAQVVRGDRETWLGTDGQQGGPEERKQHPGRGGGEVRSERLDTRLERKPGVTPGAGRVREPS
ncbi:MAG TPA: hypothetical protein VM347_07360 [Nonomuraea sp.]|nr:hypothetical protein [Nonomuraea sp.]